MFRRKFQYSTLDEAATVLRSSVPEGRQLLQQVEVLVRLLLVICAKMNDRPAACEGSRPAWLRSTMTRERLNNVAVCNVHYEYIDAVDLVIFINTFASSTERRQNTSGTLSVPIIFSIS